MLILKITQGETIILSQEFPETKKGNTELEKSISVAKNNYCSDPYFTGLVDWQNADSKRRDYEDLAAAEYTYGRASIALDRWTKKVKKLLQARNKILDANPPIKPQPLKIEITRISEADLLS